MWALRKLLVASLSLAGLSMLGCGFQGDPFQPTPVATTPSEKLEGNWLVYGTLPRLDTPIQGGKQFTGLAVSLQSVGGKIMGSAFLSGTCAVTGDSFLDLFGNAIVAVPDENGQFVTSSTGVYGWGFTLTGTAPTVGGKPWSGTYQLSNEGSNNQCAFSGSGTFTAVPVAQVTGTFSGAGTIAEATWTDQGAPAGSALSVSATMVQGVTTTAPDGTVSYDSEAQTGTLVVKGLPCFAQGKSSDRYSSGVIGNEFTWNFTMEDGSTVLAIGTIDNLATTHLLLNNFDVAGGRCAGNYTFPAPGITLSR